VDNEAVQVLMALKKVNETLLEGLKLTVFVLENENELSPERRQSIVNTLKGLIEQGEKAFEKSPAIH